MDFVKKLVPESKKLRFLAALCMIVWAAFVGMLFFVGIFPPLLSLLASVILLAALVGILKLLADCKDNHVKCKVGIVLAVILIFVLATGINYLYSTYSLFNSISDNKQVETYHVIVLRGSGYNNLDDIEGKNVYTMDFQGEALKEAKKLLRKEVNVLYEVGGDYLETGNKLIDNEGKTHKEILFISNSYYSMLCEEIDDFKWKTKAIHTLTVDVGKIDTTKAVNVTEDAFNIYVSGIDAYGSIGTVSRSDVNMIISVNPQTKEILLTSIPRDMYLTLHSFGKKDKLTHSGIYGINETVNTVEDWLDIDLNYYVRVNFTTLIGVVDAIGGIDVESERAFKSSVSQYSYVKGTNHLSGEAALYFARERKSLGGDSERIKNQQRVVKAVIDKVASPAILTKYTKILKSVQSKIQTSFTNEDITSFLQMYLGDLSNWTINSITIEGTESSGPTYSMGSNRQLYIVIPDEESVKAAQKSINGVINR